MFTGNGALVTKRGLSLAVTYYYVETGKHSRTGHLFCDVTEVDPGVFAEAMRLLCEDGLAMDVAVTQLSDRRLGFVGSCRA